MLRTVLFSLASLTLFSACGQAEFAGTYAASGETIWRVTADGLNEEARYQVGHEVKVATSTANPEADYTITVDGCPVDLRVAGLDTAAVIPGDECTYSDDGVVVREVYDSGELSMSDDSQGGHYLAHGRLALQVNDGSFRVIGTFQVSALLSKTSEWVSSDYSGGNRMMTAALLRTLDAATRE